MLHEILLSLSGHPSLLLSAPDPAATTILSPAERALLASLAHLSSLHRSLIQYTSSVSQTHPSTICRAVALAISNVHLAAFQRKILDVERGILKKDAGFVGAYDIVPLTAVVGQFEGWTRRMEWFLGVVEVMREERCTGAVIVDRLCAEMRTGYVDVEEVARSLVVVAQTAWLRQVSSWLLYGKLPSFGREDFFVKEVGGSDYDIEKELLPVFVTPSTAASLLFIGRSLNHVKVRSTSGSSSLDLAVLTQHLKQLSSLTFPIKPSEFSRVIASIRLSLSQTTLQKLLPLTRVIEILTLLRGFFLLGRGEFAIALIKEADEKIRSRWKRQDTLAYEKHTGLGNIIVKEGEVASVLARTWTAMLALQGSAQDSEEDDILELARDIVSLTISKQSPTLATKQVSSIAQTPFKNLLLSSPVSLTLSIPPPLDLFLTPQDVQIYTTINAYLLSIHRAHLRLTDLWKVTSLRREHPAPPTSPFGNSTSGRAKVRLLRKRSQERGKVMRSVWATSSAAVFLLSELTGYLQGEVVEGLWDGFKKWLVDEDETPSKPKTGNNPTPNATTTTSEDSGEGDIWLSAARISSPAPPPSKPQHDPQTLSTSHNLYLHHLISSLLLSHPLYTNALYTLLLTLDTFTSLTHRLHQIWTSLDLEADEGVVDAFSDFAKEEMDVRGQIREVEGRVKEGIRAVVASLRDVDGEVGGGGGIDREEEVEGWDEEDGFGDGSSVGRKRYRPAKVGRVDRLLMKLDFGGWFHDGDGRDAARVDGFGDSDEEL